MRLNSLVFAYARSHVSPTDGSASCTRYFGSFNMKTPTMSALNVFAMVAAAIVIALVVYLQASIRRLYHAIRADLRMKAPRGND